MPDAKTLPVPTEAVPIRVLCPLVPPCHSDYSDPFPFSHDPPRRLATLHLPGPAPRGTQRHSYAAARQPTRVPRHAREKTARSSPAHHAA